MNVIHLSAHQVKIRFFVRKRNLKGAVLILDEACERIFINEFHMELHHEPIDKMNQIMA